MEKRRKFLKDSVLGGITLSSLMLTPIETLFAATPLKLNGDSNTYNHDQQLYLSRYVPNLEYCKAIDLTTETTTAKYKAIFGEGDKDEAHLNGISRIGELTVESGGASALVRRPNEEYVLYVIQGNGSLIYDDQKVPLKTSDFLYVPAGVKHGITNMNDGPIKVLFMGYKLGDKEGYKPKDGLQIANAEKVELQVLGWHGPSTQYKLLMGDTTSTRDRLAAAYLMKSLFIMDFAPRGTNNPHRHKTQEEVYFVLKGSGYMIAGVDEYGNKERHPCQEGDAFYWAAGTEVGFYSLNKEGEEHSIILAVRSDDPTKI
tara:strand:+ start:6826 stop:7770 length:945 start_codon:yes stop_codon:yes gene_type:complete